MELIPAFDILEQVRDQKPHKMFIAHSKEYAGKFKFFSKPQAKFKNLTKN